MRNQSAQRRRPLNQGGLLWGNDSVERISFDAHPEQEPATPIKVKKKKEKIIPETKEGKYLNYLEDEGTGLEQDFCEKVNNLVNKYVNKKGKSKPFYNGFVFLGDVKSTYDTGVDSKEGHGKYISTAKNVRTMNVFFNSSSEIILLSGTNFSYNSTGASVPGPQNGNLGEIRIIKYKGIQISLYTNYLALSCGVKPLHNIDSLRYGATKFKLKELSDALAASIMIIKEGRVASLNYSQAGYILISHRESFFSDSLTLSDSETTPKKLFESIGFKFQEKTMNPNSQNGILLGIHQD